MRHRNGLNKLGLKAGHRKAMLKNMMTSLFEQERISTTKAKAKVLQGLAEKAITRAKVDSVHNRREVFKIIKNKAILNKLFTEIAPLFENRAGGYTRILKLANRKGDAAEMVLLELVEKTKKEEVKEKSSTKKVAKKPVKKVEQAKEEVVEAEIDVQEKVEEVDSKEEISSEEK